MSKIKPKWKKKMVKMLSLPFSEFDGKWGFILLKTLCLHKSHIWEISGSCVMGQNALIQKQILKSAISPRK